MKTDKHLSEKESYEASIDVLRTDMTKHRKLIVDGCVLGAANLINMALHKLNKLDESKDIRHNRLEGFILGSESFGEKSLDISRICGELEQLRYKVVIGSSSEPKDVKKAIELYYVLIEIFKKMGVLYDK